MVLNILNTQEILLWQKEINAESIVLDMTKRSSKDGIMTKRQEVLDFGMTLSDVYIDIPFHDDNWVLLRYRKNKKAFAWTYEKEGHMWVNVKVDPEWRDLWRNTYAAVIPGYHQNKEHWNSIRLDGSIPDEEVKRMIVESYDLIAGNLKFMKRR